MKAVLRNMLAATTSMIAFGGMVTGAHAGGFINSSQSSVFNGMSYAGFAAPGSTSAATMFLNPATMTGFRNFTIDSNYTLGMPVTKITGVTTPNIGGPRTSGDIGQDYLVPATYIVAPITDRLFAGVSLNSPYGNTTKADPTWIGRSHSITTKLRTYTLTPALAYAVNDWISVGAGLQIQYATIRQYADFTGLAPGAGIAGIAKSHGWGVGWTLGATITPVKGTQIGIGWRSLIDQNIEGTTVNGAAPARTNTKGVFNLPNRVNVSLRQTVNQKFDFLASVEWQNWGRIGAVALTNSAIPAVQNFNYKDGWFFSVGGEYKATDALTVRSGIGYEMSPVTDQVRSTSLPDNDRIWLSAGLTYSISERFSLNASYSHLFIKNANLSVRNAAGIVFNGNSKAHADLFSLGLTSTWGGSPKKEEPLVKKF